MIAIMRKLIHNNAYRVILWFFLLMMGLGSLLVTVSDNKQWAVKVYDQTVSTKKFYNILRSAEKLEEEFRQRGIDIGGKRDAKRDAVEGALTIALTDHATHNLKFRISENLFHKSFQERIASLPPHFFKADGQLDQQAFERVIAPMTMDDFVDNVQDEIKNKVLFSVVRQAVYVPQYELKMHCDAEFAHKEYSVMVFALKDFIAKAKATEPSEAELEKFYKKHKDRTEFKTAEKRAGVLWMFDENSYASSVSDKEVKSHYDKIKHSKYVIDPATVQVRVLTLDTELGQEDNARVQIQEIKEKADRNPESFENMVKEFSHDKAFALKGGVTDFFSRNDTHLDKAIVQAAFEELATDGQISAPIKTQKGFALIQQVARKAARFKEFKTVQADIKKELIQDRFKKRFKQDAERVINQMKYNPEALESFVNRYHGEKKDLSLDVRKDSSQSAQLFRTDELKSSVYFEGSLGIIVTCTHIEKSRSKELNEVKKEVLTLYYEQKAQDLLHAAMTQAQQEAKSGDFADIAKKLGATVKQASYEFKDGKVEISSLLDHAKTQAKLKDLSLVGALIQAVDGDQGLIIKLDAVSSQKDSDFAEEKETIKNTTFHSKLYLVRDGFVDSLYRHAKLHNKVEIKDELLHLIK